MSEKILEKEGKIHRHGFTARFVHWTVAVSTLLLIFSGLGQMPIYRRYFIDQIPGLGWSSNYEITLKLHYLMAVVLIFAVSYHITYHIIRKEFDILPRRGDIRESILIIKAMFGLGNEPPSDKYLAEQRLAYGFIGFSLVLVIVTGIVKLLKNLPGINLPDILLNWATNLHNLATFLIIFGIIVHLAAFIFKENRFLLPGIFTGKVDLNYVKHRHTLWYDRLKAKEHANRTKIRQDNHSKG